MRLRKLSTRIVPGCYRECATTHRGAKLSRELKASGQVEKLDPGTWIHDPEPRILDTEVRVLNPASQIQEPVVPDENKLATYMSSEGGEVKDL